MEPLRTVTLSSQRQLSFAIYGSPASSRWVIYHHGFPGSRLEGSLWDGVARKHGVSILAPDRPGFGSTDTYPERTLREWPRDLSELCQILKISRATVIGVSGGGPYALVSAYALPHLIASAEIVSSLSPLEIVGAKEGMALGNRLMFGLMQHAPNVGRLAVRGIGTIWARSAKLCLAWFKAFVPPCDRVILNRREFHVFMLQNIRTAFERGFRGAVADFEVITRPWGFSLGDIKIPVTVWHGLADTYVPPAMGRYIASTIPGAQSRMLPNGGHLLVIEELEEILEAAINHLPLAEPRSEEKR